MLPHQAIGHDDQVSRLARRVRGQGGGRVTDGTLKVQRTVGQGQQEGGETILPDSDNSHDCYSDGTLKMADLCLCMRRTLSGLMWLWEDRIPLGELIP